jgi:ferredoxin
MSESQIQTVEISFRDTKFKPVQIPKGGNPSEHLNITNSPILFGCRTGICGTCLVSVSGHTEPLEGPDADELDVLETLAPDQPNLRLACQLKANCPMTLKMEDSI